MTEDTLSYPATVEMVWRAMSKEEFASVEKTSPPNTVMLLVISFAVDAAVAVSDETAMLPLEIVLISANKLLMLLAVRVDVTKL